MTEISVLYFGPLRDLAGKRRETVKISGTSSLADLLEAIRKSHDQKFSNFIFEGGGKIRGSIAFAADGRSILRSDLKRIKCKNVNEFVILPPISGG